MRYLCSQCGSEIGDDAEFCYACGSLKSKAINIPDVADVTGGLVGVCRTCGESIRQGETHCSKCGASIASQQVIIIRPKLTKWGIIGLLLAIIPGSFGFFGILLLPSIFGLGHLALKKWKRGLMFLSLSILIGVGNFLTEQNGTSSASSDALFFIMILFIYFLQTTEVMALAFLSNKAD
jgi:hypothetical protein